MNASPYPSAPRPRRASTTAARIVALALALLPMASVVEAAPRHRVAQGSPAADPTKRARIKQRVLALRAATLTRELGLDEATAARLFPILARHDDELMRLTRAAAGLRRAADDAIARGDDPAVNRAIDELLANQRARWALEEARFQDVRRVLTPAQSARVLVVLPAIERRIHHQIRRALEGRRHGGRGHPFGPGRRGDGRRDRDEAAQ